MQFGQIEVQPRTLHQVVPKVLELPMAIMEMMLQQVVALELPQGQVVLALPLGQVVLEKLTQWMVECFRAVPMAQVLLKALMAEVVQGRFRQSMAEGVLEQFR